MLRSPKEPAPHRHEQEHAPLDPTDPVPLATDALGGADTDAGVATGAEPAAGGEAGFATADAVPF